MENTIAAKHPSLGYWLLLLTLLPFCIGILLPPYFAHAGNPSLASFTFKLYAPFCHQLPTRTLFVWGSPMAVCARDFGIYFAMLLMLLIHPLFKKTSDAKVPHPIPLILSIIPIGIDGGTQIIANLTGLPLYWLAPLGYAESFNEMRVVTGAIFGIVSVFYMIPIANIVCSVAYESFWQLVKEKKF